MEKNLGKHDWLGRYYRLDWKNSTESKLSITYRREGKVNDVILDSEKGFSATEKNYHVELYYAEELEYWGVSKKPRKMLLI